MPAAPPDPAGPQGTVAERTECAPNCEVSYAIPIEPGRGCVDHESPGRVPVCQCEPIWPATCMVRASDNAAFLVPESQQSPGLWQDTCTERQREAAQIACDYAQCEEPPASSCTLADFCSVRECGGLEYTEDGCHRPACSRDADCPGGTRCAELGCADVFQCDYGKPGQCRCSGALLCQRGRVCAPVELAGPRGDWVSLRMEEWIGECDGGGDCHRVWEFAAEDEFHFDTGFAETPPVEWVWSVRLVPLLNASEFRLAMDKGPTCPAAPPGFVASIELELTTGSVTRDVSGCVAEGVAHDDNVFALMFMIARSL